MKDYKQRIAEDYDSLRSPELIPLSVKQFGLEPVIDSGRIDG